MGLLLMEGFDAGDILQKRGNQTNTGTTTVTRFSSGRALDCNSQAIGGNKYLLPSAAAQFYVGFAWAHTRAADIPASVMGLYGDGGATLHLYIGWSSTTTMFLKRGDGTVLATYATPWPVTTGSWWYIEMGGTIADSGGTCTVKVNGATVMSYTGDTKNGGTNASIDAISPNTSAGGYSSYFDDIYVCDGTGSAPFNTFLGEIRVSTLVPTGAGSSTQFTPSTGANWSCVDELPFSATDYVSDSVVGHRDTYAMADLYAGASNVLAVQNCLVAKKSDAGAVNLKSALKVGATVYTGSAQGLSTGDVTYMDLRTQNPATAAAWSVSDVNALEAGVEVA